MGISNIGEQDFFAWVLAPEVEERTCEVFRQIAASLIVYDLKKIDEDLLKQLYQNLVEAETRHELGEFYTPDWLAELTLREIEYKPGQSLLDPACGSGTFLFTALRRLVEQGMTGAEAGGLRAGECRRHGRASARRHHRAHQLYAGDLAAPQRRAQHVAPAIFPLRWRTRSRFPMRLAPSR